MGLMDKFRASTKYILWLLLFSFVILWSLADTQVFDTLMSGPRSLGTVNGEAITFEEYNQTVNGYMQNYQAQTGQSPTAELRSYYEELAWENLVTQKLLDDQMKRLGIKVTDEEVLQQITGPNPAPFIAQQFTRQDGTIDRVALQQAIEAPENADVWVSIENQIREQLSMQKLNQYILNSIKVSDTEARMAIANERSMASAQYLRFPYSEITDDQISVTDSDLNAYLKKHAKRYKQDKSYRFRYVTFNKQATAADSTRILGEINAKRDAFVAASSDSLFLVQNASVTRFNRTFISRNQLPKEFGVVFGMANGQVSQPIVTEGKVSLIKKLESRAADQKLVRVSQIQLAFTETNRAEVQAKADDLSRQARGGDFAELARANSMDFTTSAEGGDLGFILPADRPQPIADAIKDAAVGSVVGPVEFEGSLYLFKITGAETQEVRFAEFALALEADPFDTVEKMAKEADDFSFYAKEDGFEAEAKRRNITPQEAFATEGNAFISGLGQSRVVLNALMRAEVGNVSNSIDMDTQFIVFEVMEILPEGTRKLDDVRNQIEALVRNEKRKELLTEKITKSISGKSDLQAMAQATGKAIERADSLSLVSDFIGTAGREPEVIGAIFGSAVNKVSKPIAGENALFIIQVIGKTMADPSQVSPQELVGTRARLQQMRASMFQQNWLEELKSKADIEDFRTRVLVQ
jgi:parvulin-like peptidyl-prolyl isomerase